MNEFLLVDNLEQVKRNVVQFNHDIKENEELRKRFLSRYRQWYYIAELNMFAPSKYIGYKEMNAQKYNNKDDTGADGRKTEAVLRKWFIKKDKPELLEELRNRMLVYGKIKKNSEIHILKYELLSFSKKVKDRSTIRILPMSEKDPEFIGKSIEEVQNGFVSSLTDRNYNFKKGMDSDPGTLVLFQYRARIIAMAILESKTYYENINDYGYKGFYRFIPESVATFIPLTNKEIKSIWPRFKGFNQSLQKLEFEQYKLFQDFLLNKNIRYILKDERNEESFQKRVENNNVDSKLVIDDRPYIKTETLFKNASNVKYQRNPRVSKKAIVLAEFKCEFKSNHLFFNSSVTEKNYVEAHHLVPMEFQDQFEYSLDVEANIVSLCPLCHKRIHHAIFKEKIDLLKMLFVIRKDRLKKCNIEVDLKMLYSFYK